MGASNDRTNLERGVLGAAALSAVAVALLAARVTYTHDLELAFFAWNLGLAWVPFGVSVAARAALDRVSGRGAQVALLLTAGAVWLPFFPNAPYLLTDLVHIKERTGVPLWFDVAMIGAFALAGFALAVRSLDDAFALVERIVGARAAWLTVTAVALLSGFGIYIGRFLRWNTWDLLLRPGPLLADLAGRVLDPLAHPRTWGMTVVLAALLLAAWLNHRYAAAPARA